MIQLSEDLSAPEVSRDGGDDMTEQEMLRQLGTKPTGTPLFVSYDAGRKPTHRAVLEAWRHVNNPQRARRHFVGLLHSVWQTKKGEWVVTVFCWNRDTLASGLLEEGAFRTFNPNLGQLHCVSPLC
jgi:hypothetical protein